MTFSVTDVDEIFAAALQLSSAEERAEYVERACGENADLRKRVDDLLAAYFKAGEFLQRPPVTVLHRQDEDIQAGPGTVIGPYKLLQQIGEGGMGVVFMAEQTEPIHRIVALKIIKPGMDTRQVIARFEAERQALAMMDHPNIARVIDAGTTDTGRPFFVMDLVKGVPITDYCDQQHLSVRQRLELIGTVCQAVQHAHQKGIIHRDIKPSNVLVAEYDGKPVPKIIDFGVAKATAQKLTERTMFTEFGQVIGTVEYMSPEQARFNQLDVDTRSDIYSLGVLLYELLTGSTPFERKRLREAAFDEVLRIIREEEPPKPSTRLSSSDALPSIAANRHSEPARLTKDVHGELDWIVMRSLEKDRNRRYETANGLARDLERYLQDEPVLACPPSRGYRFRKFARRNKRLLVTGALFGLALIAGTVASTWQAIRATRAEKIAGAQRTIAQQEADKQQAINQFLNKMLQSANPWARTAADKFKGRDATVVQVCDSAIAKLDAGALKDRPEIEAALRATIGETYGSLDRRSAGEAQLREAVRLGQLAYGTEHLELAAFKISLAKNLTEQYVDAKLDEAEALMRDGLRIRQKLLPTQDLTDGSATLCHILLRKCEGTKDEKRLSEAEQIAHQIKRPQLLARVFYQQGKFAEGDAQYRQLLADLPQRLANQPVQQADLFFQFARELKNRGSFTEAEPYYRKALRLDPDRVQIKTNFARCLQLEGKFSEAEPLLREALKLQRSMLGENDPAVHEIICSLAQVVSSQGKRADAEGLLRNALEKQPNSGELWTGLADLLVSQQKFEEAAESARKAIELDSSNYAAHRALTIALQRLRKFDEAIAASREAVRLNPTDPQAHYYLGNLLRETGRLDEAIQAYREAIKLKPQTTPWSHFKLGRCLETKGRLDEAIDEYRASMKAGSDIPEVPLCLAAALSKNGQHDEAQIVLKERIERAANDTNALNALAWLFASAADAKLRDPARAVELATKATKLAPQDGAIWNTLGVAQYRAGNWQAAIEALSKSLELQKANEGYDWFFLAMSHGQLGHKEEAREWYDKAVKWMDKNAPKNEELVHVRAEAAELLGVTQPQPPADSSKQPQSTKPSSP